MSKQVALSVVAVLFWASAIHAQTPSEAQKLVKECGVPDKFQDKFLELAEELFTAAKAKDQKEFNAVVFDFLRLAEKCKIQDRKLREVLMNNTLRTGMLTTQHHLLAVHVGLRWDGKELFVRPASNWGSDVDISIGKFDSPPLLHEFGRNALVVIQAGRCHAIITKEDVPGSPFISTLTIATLRKEDSRTETFKGEFYRSK